MAITITTPTGDITAKELIDGFSKGISPGGPVVEKKYLVPWDQSDAFANAISGLTYGVGGVAGTIIRQAPHQCPESTNLYCLSVGPIEGWGAPTIDGGRPRYEQAIVPVHYGVPTFQLGGSLNTIDPYNQMNFSDDVYPYASQSIDYDSESYTTKHEWKYAAGGSGVAGTPITDGNLTIDVPVATMAITLHRVPFMPKKDVFGLLKCVNSTGFLDEPAGTVLFHSLRTNLVLNSDGTSTLDLDLVFRWRRPGWNVIPHPTDGSTWIPFTHDGTSGGRKAYALRDLRAVLYGLSLNASDPAPYANPYV